MRVLKLPKLKNYGVNSVDSEKMMTHLAGKTKDQEMIKRNDRIRISSVVITNVRSPFAGLVGE